MEKIKVLLVDDDLLFGNIATKILQAVPTMRSIFRTHCLA